MCQPLKKQVRLLLCLFLICHQIFTYISNKTFHNNLPRHYTTVIDYTMSCTHSHSQRNIVARSFSPRKHTQSQSRQTHTHTNTITPDESPQTKHDLVMVAQTNLRTRQSSVDKSKVFCGQIKSGDSVKQFVYWWKGIEGYRKGTVVYILKQTLLRFCGLFGRPLKGLSSRKVPSLDDQSYKFLRTSSSNFAISRGLNQNEQNA